jgi:polyketide biosynthesis acyl carrier protein
VTRSAVRATLLAVIGEILPWRDTGDVADDDSLGDLGADSVERAEIISLLLYRLESGEPASEFAALATVGALVDRLAKEGQR